MDLEPVFTDFRSFFISVRTARNRELFVYRLKLLLVYTYWLTVYFVRYHFFYHIVCFVSSLNNCFKKLFNICCNIRYRVLITYHTLVGLYFSLKLDKYPLIFLLLFLILFYACSLIFSLFNFVIHFLLTCFSGASFADLFFGSFKTLYFQIFSPFS